MIPTEKDFVSAMEASNLVLSESQMKIAARFASILHRENEIQNLTRILGASEFVQGHLIDVIELLGKSSLGKKVMDIGSGSGVPGLLAAALDTDSLRSWQLIESEISKAEYLKLCAAELGLNNVMVVHARADEIIRELAPDTVIARAVGTVEKISSWIWKCSTWNNLILFKSRGWEEEWNQAQMANFGKKLTVTHAHDYSNLERSRYLISLSRIKK